LIIAERFEELPGIYSGKTLAIDVANLQKEIFNVKFYFGKENKRTAF